MEETGKDMKGEETLGEKAANMAESTKEAVVGK